MPEFRYTLTERLVNTALRGLFHLLVRLDVDELRKIPRQGPLLLFTNHINIVEAPIIYTELQYIHPRYLTGFAKAEYWDSAEMAFLFRTWDVIPLHRDEADLSAIKEAVARIKDGQTFAMAPEGTRSHTGEMQRAHPGVAMLGYLSGAPIIPIANYGHENYKDDLKHLHRTEFHVRVGPPFHLDSGGKRINNTVRQQMADEMMYILAAMLPEKYRGAYADLSQATTDYIVWDDAPPSLLPE
jgi:1-acyl-sn-glycerol-3-phosphate acyltransferase